MLSGIIHQLNTVLWHTIDQYRLHGCIRRIKLFKRCLLRVGNLHKRILRQFRSVLADLNRRIGQLRSITVKQCPVKSC